MSDKPEDVSVTIYRDPQRSDTPMNLNYLRGFALISEKRTITLPAGPSTIRFEGVAEGMVAVSAIVTGLPGGVAQKNRDKNLLSPASLIDGTLGNRVTIRRTNPATGVETTREAIIRTGANGGVVLQTEQGFEALRCAGLPETLVYDEVPEGLSATPVLSVDTVSPEPVTATVTLTYLASGFDWSAHYVGQLSANGARMQLLAWLTLANMNAESFRNAEVMAVAGTLNVEQPYDQLADRPETPRLRLTCYPMGSTADGTDYPDYRAEMEEADGAMMAIPAPAPVMAPPPPPPSAQKIVVTGSRIARQEELGDLKLYRVPFRSTIAANAQKQVALLVKDAVAVTPVYVADWNSGQDMKNIPMQVELRMQNKEQQGLGAPLPSGGITIFTPVNGENLLLGEADLRDFAVDEKVEFAITESAQVRFSNIRKGEPHKKGWQAFVLEISNSNPAPVDAEIRLGPVAFTDYRRVKGGKVRKKDGRYVWKVRVPANGNSSLRIQLRNKE